MHVFGTHTFMPFHVLLMSHLKFIVREREEGRGIEAEREMRLLLTELVVLLL